MLNRQGAASVQSLRWSSGGGGPPQSIVRCVRSLPLPDGLYQPECEVEQSVPAGCHSSFMSPTRIASCISTGSR